MANMYIPDDLKLELYQNAKECNMPITDYMYHLRDLVNKKALRVIIPKSLVEDFYKLANTYKKSINELVDLYIDIYKNTLIETITFEVKLTDRPTLTREELQSILILGGNYIMGKLTQNLYRTQSVQDKVSEMYDKDCKKNDDKDGCITRDCTPN